MKKLLFILLLIMMATQLANAQQTKKNIFSAFMGIWDQDNEYYGGPDHKFGITGGLEYHRILNDYFSVRGDFFTGIISRSSYHQSQRMVGLTAGLMLAPFGKRFSNLQIGISPGCVWDTWQYVNNRTGSTVIDRTNLFVIKFPLRFYFVDNAKYRLGMAYDFITHFKGGFSLFTGQVTLSYGLKF